MNRAGRGLRSFGLLAGLAVGLVSGRAEAGWSEQLAQGWDAARAAEQSLLDQAREAIVVGGVVPYRHRHAVAGAALGQPLDDVYSVP